MDNFSAKQKIIIQAVCVILAVALWFYVTNIESPTTNYQLNKVPVQLNNVDILKELGLALEPSQNLYVNLKLEGSTQDIFRISRNDFKVSVDLGEYALKVGENKVPVNIIDFPSGINIKNSNGLTISLMIEERIEKEMTIESNIDIIAKPGYYVATPVFKPQTIKVSGPKSVVDTVDSVLAEGTEDNISDTVVKSYGLECIDEHGNSIDGVDMSQKIVSATIEVNEGKSVPIKINTIGNLGSNMKLKSIESTLTQVGLSGSKDILDSIHEIETEEVDLSSIEANTELNVNLVIPDGVKIYEGEEVTTVKISIDKVESKEITVSFNVINAATGVRVVPSVKEINVKLTGYKADIDAITADKIKAELDVSKYTEAGTFSETPTVSLVDSNSAVSVEALGKISFDVVKEAEVTTSSNGE